MKGPDLTAFRERFRMSKSALALELELDRRTVAKYEESASPIPRNIALACAALALGLPPYGGADDKTP